MNIITTVEFINSQKELDGFDVDFEAHPSHVDELETCMQYTQVEWDKSKYSNDQNALIASYLNYNREAIDQLFTDELALESGRVKKPIRRRIQWKLASLPIIAATLFCSCANQKHLHYSGEYKIKTRSGNATTFYEVPGTYILESDTLKANDKVKIAVIRAVPKRK
ncbi:MAG: hypothetical protein ABIN94_05720 [Ferruginibacter sp.]